MSTVHKPASILVHPHPLQVVSSLRHHKNCASLHYSVIQPREIQLAAFSLSDFKIELWFAFLHFPLFSLLHISFLHLRLRLDRNMHGEWPPHSPFPPLFLPCNSPQGWLGASRTGTNSASPLHPPASLIPNQSKSSLFEVKGSAHTHPVPTDPRHSETRTLGLLPDTCSQVIFQLPIST